LWQYLPSSLAQRHIGFPKHWAAPEIQWFYQIVFSIPISDLKFHYFSSNLCAFFVGKPKPEIYTSHTLPRKGHVQSLGHRNEVNSASLQWEQWREGWRVGFMLEEMSAAMRGAVAGCSK